MYGKLLLMLEKIRVLQVVGDSKFGGASIVVLDIMDALSKDGFDVTILATDPEMIGLAKDAGFNVLIFAGIQRKLNPLKDLYVAIKLSRQIKGKYDVIHTHTSKGGAIGRFAGKIAGIPTIVHTVHGFAYHEFSSRPVKFIGSWIERLLGYMCNRVIFVNNHDREQAIKDKVLPEEKCITILNGISDSRLQPDSTLDRNDMLNSLGLPDDSVLGVSVGRLAKQKGLSYLLEAIKIVIIGRPDYYHAIIGDGELLEELQEEAALLGISNNVMFLGFQKDAVRWTKICDVFVLSSLWEGHSMTLLEAMGLGKAIVATDIKGNRESLSDNINGLLVCPADPEDLSRGILKVLSDPDKAASLGLNAKVEFEREFTVQRMQEQVVGLYRAMVRDNN